MRCSRCGNDNPETNRFCGMCGELLVPAASGPPASARTAPQTAPVRTGSLPVATPAQAQGSATQNLGKTAPQRASAPVTEQQVPSIAGPSFLGLSQPGPAVRSTKSDPQLQRTSGNLDYLLEDEEEPKRGWGKVLFALVALGLLLGFGYLRWRGQGLDWLTSGLKKPSAAAQPSDSSQPADAPQPAASTPAPASGDPSSAPAASQPNAALPTPAGSGVDSAASAKTPNAASGAADASGTPGGTAATSAPAATSAATPVQTPAPTPAQKGQPAASATDSASDSEEKSDDEDAATPPAPKSRPAAKPSPVRTADPVAEAEKYIYGRGGVRQDCDRGLKLLRPAAEKANPKAMVSLGALYSAGLCTPRDLPTSYRWFALALRKEPDNRALQTDLQKLWSEMTLPERQLAIKLSQ